MSLLALGFPGGRAFFAGRPAVSCCFLRARTDLLYSDRVVSVRSRAVATLSFRQCCADGNWLDPRSGVEVRLSGAVVLAVSLSGARA